MTERFSDIADEASRIESAIIEMQIAALRARSQALNLDNQSGLCWYCDAETGIARRFCNKDCAELWSRDNE